MMIPRKAAESLVALLESALDSLRGAHSYAEAACHRDLTARIDPAWAATANTGGLLALIYDAYPDLPGEDPVDAVMNEVDPLGSKGDTEEQVRLKLLDAVSQLELAATASDAAEAMTVEDKEEVASRLSESLTALRMALQRLAQSPRDP